MGRRPGPPISPFHRIAQLAREHHLLSAFTLPLDVLGTSAYLSPGHKEAMLEAGERLAARTVGQLLWDEQLPPQLSASLGPRAVPQIEGELEGWLMDEAPGLLEAEARARRASAAIVADREHRGASPRKHPGRGRSAVAVRGLPVAEAAASSERPAPRKDGDLDSLVAWAEGKGLGALLDAPLSATVALLPAMAMAANRFGLERPLRALLTSRLGGRALTFELAAEVHLQAAAERLVRDAAAALGAERKRRARAQSRAVEPQSPALRALLGWLREAEARLAALALPSLPGMVVGESVVFRAGPPRIDYSEQRLLGGLASVSLPVGAFQLEPLELGRLGAETDDPVLLRAVRAAIELLLHPGARTHPALVSWLESPRWAEVLERLDTTAEASLEPGERLAFRLSEHRGQMTITPLVQRPAARGGWSAGQPTSPERLLAQGTTWLDPLEERLVAQLAGRGFGGQDEPHRAALFALLEQLGAHPRVYLDDRRDVPLRVAHQKLGLELVAAEGGLLPRLSAGDLPVRASQLLGHIDERGRAIVIDRGAPSVALLELDARAVSLVRVLSEVGAMFPAEGQEALVARLAQLQGPVELKVPVELTGRAAEPEGRLLVRVEPLAEGISVLVLARPIAHGAVFAPGQGPGMVLGHLAGERVHAIRRLEDEREAARSLLGRLGFGDVDVDVSSRLVIEDDARAVELLGRLEQLQSEGTIELELPEHRPRVVKQAFPDDLDLLVRKARDWFSVGGGIEVDGALVALADLLLAARSGEKYVAMGKRRFLALSDELRIRLLEADGALSEQRGALGVSPLAISALDRLVDGKGRIDADEALVELRASIKRAAQSEPQAPAGLRADLRPYQLEGYRWLMRLSAWGAGACLADEMGLGKTLQTLGVLVARASLGPQLVVAPTSVGPNWVAEAGRFAPHLEPLLYRGPDRAALLESAGPRSLVITSYDLMARDAEALSSREFATLVLDEAQAIKNPETNRARAASLLQAGFRIALSGTPIENRLAELWSLFRVIAPGLLGSQEHFQARFSVPIERDLDAEKRAALSRLVRPFLLRRTKAQVAPELPPRIELVKHVELSPAERALYEAARRRAIAEIEAIGSERDARFEILAQLTRLRRLACHPRLIDDESTVGSSKLEAFLELLGELRAERHRALVFSQFTSHLALVREALDARGVQYLYLDGSTPAAERPALVEAFQRGEGELFLISLKAGGTGLNLTAADTVIHLDPWWNPAVEDQASDRAHRIGQSRTVTVVRLICRGTIEEAVVALHAEKRELAEALLEGAEAAARWSSAELTALVLAGAS